MQEYTGTAIFTNTGQEPVIYPVIAYKIVKDIDSKHSIHFMNMSKVNNAYAPALRSEHSQELRIKLISDLADYFNKNPGKLTFASSSEFANLPDHVSPLILFKGLRG